MRIGIDISSIPYGTGVSRYTANLVRSLRSHLDGNDLVLFGSSFRYRHHLKTLTRCLYPFPPRLTSFLFNTLHFPIESLTGPLDVFHAWDWQVPATKSALVSTVHDLALFKYPGTAHPEIERHHRQTLAYLKTHAARLIAVSNTTKQDLIELFQIPAERIDVIPEALPPESALVVSPADITAVRTRFNLTKPYFLIVGTQAKRKNLDRQITAWQHYRRDFDLVLAGQPGTAPIPPQNGLILTGYVDQTTLAALYAGAAILLYVSLYEGFGLPILEAFYHRLPVVTGNLSAMPEVGGDAAIYADPQRPESIMVAIAQALQQKEALIAKGADRLKLFSWDLVAQQTLNTYRKAVSL